MRKEIIAASILMLTSLPSPAEEESQSRVLEVIIVSAQRVEEDINSVPIAVSAFSGEALDERNIDTSVDLQNYVPNFNYTGASITGGATFSIRGVGAAVGGTTADHGVASHYNNAPIIVPRTSIAEFYDVARIEILRGPQGTLYGRNATGGVINLITAKPEQEFGADLDAEVASFNSLKVRGHVNIPLGDMLSMRAAGIYLTRDGYTDNLETGNDIDDRDLYSTRVSLSFDPIERFNATLVWEHFKEDDSRNAGARTMCIKDPGPTMVGSTPITNPDAQLYLSQGCRSGSVYSPEARDNPNSVSTFGGRYGYILGLVPGDVFAGQTLPQNLRDTSFYLDPDYEVKNDVVTLDVGLDLTDQLMLNVLGAWSKDQQYSRSGSHEAEIGFADTPLTPGGIYDDYQGGPASGIRTLTISDLETEQYSVEVRLQSAFAGPLNFNLGGLYLDVDRLNHTFVSTNSTVLFARASGLPLYFDPNPIPDYTGHQYFLSKTPYWLKSKAVFGELYWDVSDTFTITAGLRYSDDKKDADATPILLFTVFGEDGIGTPGWPPSGSGSIQRQTISFDKVTGRLVADWRPDLGFTDETLIYASFSRGYKAGGFNSPDDPNDGQSFKPYKPETLNAYEIGTKNTLLDQRMQLNVTAFYYDYKDYQVSLAEQFSLRNTNVDAEVKGLEIETVVEPVENFIIGANIGLQDSKIKNGTSVDPFNRTQGDPDYTYLATASAGCVVPTASLEPMIRLINLGVLPAAILANVSPGANNDLCEGGYAGPGNPLAGLGIDITPSAGIPADLKGNQLAHTPKVSLHFSAQYTWRNLFSGWDATLRGDYSWKDDAYTSHFNGVDYELKSWDNANAALTLNSEDRGIAVTVFGKNLFDDDTIVDYGVAGEGVGSTRGVTLLEPRLFGIRVNVTL